MSRRIGAEAADKKLHPDGEFCVRMEGRPPGDGAAGCNWVRCRKTKRNLVLHDDVQGHVRGDGLVVERGGTEARLADRGGHRLVEKVVRRLHDLDVLRLAVFVDIELEHNFRIVEQGICCGGGELNPGGVEDVCGFDTGGKGTG